MARVKSFEDFSFEDRVNEDNSVWDDITGFLGRIIPSLGEGFTRTIKQKVSAAIIEKIGVREDTTLSALVQEIVASIPVADLPGIITGSKANAEYLAPLLAEATQNFIQRKGLENLMQPLGAEPNGWLVATIRNSIQGEIGKDRLEKMYAELLGSESLTPSVMSKFSDEEKQKLSGDLAQQAMRAYPTTAKGLQSTPGQGSTDKRTGDFESLTNFFSGMFGGEKKSS